MSLLLVASFWSGSLEVFDLFVSFLVVAQEYRETVRRDESKQPDLVLKAFRPWKKPQKRRAPS